MIMPHECTDQEDQILAHMEVGEWDEIQEMEDAIFLDDTENPQEATRQFKEDYTNAYAHYQENHEIPEEERIENTALVVEEQNTEAEAELEQSEE